jgi:RNA polymerase sigma-70 factor (ECF subfamily)
MHEAARTFEEHRPLLRGIAYRMVGALGEAEDIVQDTWLKWSRAKVRAIRDPRAWLVTACTRQALDVLKSARVRRENYCARFMVGVLHERPPARAATRIVAHWFNGAPGVLIHENGRLITAPERGG